MSRPRRPAPVVAAGVLVIIVGSELLLAGAALVGVTTWWAIEDAAPPSFWLLAVSAVVLGLGTELLVVGVKALRGTLQRPLKAADRVIGFGTLFALPSFLSMACCGITTFIERHRLLESVTEDTAKMLAALLTLWATTAATLTAGLLLRKNADRYLAWQEAIRRQRADAEYEPE